MRLQLERDRRGLLFRWRNRDYQEHAYARIGPTGLKAEVEFPSDWHEQRRAWVRLGFGIGSFSFSFPWAHVVPDNHQCSGPTYGFSFFEDVLFLRWGKCHGKRNDPVKVIAMPWQWRHINSAHKRLTDDEQHEYRYRLQDGHTQRVIATIHAETRSWWRPWPPFRKTVRSIDVDFSAEVGERAGSWKGGVLGCSYRMLPHEAPRQTLRRMERERKFT